MAKQHQLLDAKGNQSVLELTRHQNNLGFNLVSRTVQDTTISNPRVIQKPATTTEPFFQVNAFLPSILAMEQPLPATSHRVWFHPDLFNTTTFQNEGMTPTSSTINMVPGILNT